MIRKLRAIIEEIHQTVSPPTCKAAAIAVIWNPFTGHRASDLSELTEMGEHLGYLLGERAVAALGIDPAAAQSCGKAAIVGEDGELEHAAAILHPKRGVPLRRTVETATALILSAKKRGGMAASIGVPPGHQRRPCQQPLRRHGNPRAACPAAR